MAIIKSSQMTLVRWVSHFTDRFSYLMVHSLTPTGDAKFNIFIQVNQISITISGNPVHSWNWNFFFEKLVKRQVHDDYLDIFDANYTNYSIRKYFRDFTTHERGTFIVQRLPYRFFKWPDYRIDKIFKITLETTDLFSIKCIYIILFLIQTPCSDRYFYSKL